MTDYSWIKPGVKARVISSRCFPEMIGEVVTITGEPEVYLDDNYEDYLGVPLEKPPASEGIEFAPPPSAIEPITDFTTGSWDEIEKATGWTPTKVMEDV